jgi:hypothetical protein
VEHPGQRGPRIHRAHQAPPTQTGTDGPSPENIGGFRLSRPIINSSVSSFFMHARIDSRVSRRATHEASGILIQGGAGLAHHALGPIAHERAIVLPQ